MTSDVSRRRFLAGLGAASGLALTGLPAVTADAATPPPGIRQPGDRPFPRHPEGVDDFLPRIEHVIIYMQENHSYDSFYGMLPRGDGYTMHKGVPQNHNPLSPTQNLKVFHAPDTCQLGEGVSQNWANTHTEANNGHMNGFLFNGNTNAMRYWDGHDLPFYYSLAQTFPICDRWFAAAPCQTYPNRLYMQAATCQTLISTSADVLTLPHPAGGTIWDKLNAFGITWNDYAWDLPDIALFQHTFAANASHVKSFNQFLLDCQSGSLPQVSIVSPGINAYTEENPADVQLGEAYSSSIINAVMHSPAWPKTALFFMYDEHGGYYDHVPPAPAIPPDDILPAVAAAPGAPDAWNITGLRVPGFVISPYAKPGYVSSVVRDHTAVLRFIETKFNLGALTRRDANADNMLDCFDFSHRSFAEPPALAAPGLPATGSRCTPSILPPPTVPTPPAPAATAQLASAASVATAGGPGVPLSDSMIVRQELLAYWQERGFLLPEPVNA
jgi:phospholipase C